MNLKATIEAGATASRTGGLGTSSKGTIGDMAEHPKSETYGGCENGRPIFSTISEIADDFGRKVN